MLHFYFTSDSVFNLESLFNKCPRGHLRAKASPFRRSPSSVGLSPAVEKKLQTPCGQMTKFSRGESRAGVCFPAATPVVCLFIWPFLSPPLRARDPAQPPVAPGLKRVASDQGWLTTSVRENYLHHEWTCLFGETAP